MGVPCVLSAKGLESVIEIDLDAQERSAFDASAASVREDIGRLADIA
jgi:malate/lactate dehydrogenase